MQTGLETGFAASSSSWMNNCTYNDVNVGNIILL